MSDTHGSVNLDFLKVEWRIGDGGVKVDVRVGVEGLSWSDSVNLSIFHPSVSISSPHVAGVYVGVSLSLDDGSGKLAIDATAHWPFDKHGKSVGGKVQVLPPFIFGLIGVGAKFPKVLDYAPQIAQAGLSYKYVLDFKKSFDHACHLGATADELTGFIGIANGDLFTGLARLAPEDAKAREQIASLSPSALSTAILAVVADPRVQAAYPGIQNRIVPGGKEGARPAIGTDLASARAAPATAAESGAPIGMVILEILGALAVLAGLLAAALAALAGMIQLILAVVAATTMVVLTGVLAGIGVLLCAGVVIVAAAGMIAVVVALIIGLVFTFRAAASAAESAAPLPGAA